MNICFNGGFFDADAPVITAQNRSFKWGDGLFETMKVVNGKLLLESLHFERMFISLQLLQMELSPNFTQEKLVQNIIALCTKNSCTNCARIRLHIFRNEDNSTGYLIEAFPLDEIINEWQAEGQVLVLYPYARKSIDAFANIKSANFLPYVLTQKFAIENGADDGIILNSQQFVCDSSKANIFFVKDDEIFTPALHQGCINGVMRRVVIEQVKELGFRLHQGEVKEEQLHEADEMFLTNAIQIIRWVKQYKTSSYGFATTKKIFEAVVNKLFNEKEQVG
jgi:branched-chain amino acid aminotransferase